MSKQYDPFTQHVLAMEKKLFGEDASPELTHAYRMGVTVAMKFVCEHMQQHIQQISGPAN